MKATHEHEWEAAPGLPSDLPPGERVVWQGAPDWKRLAIHAFHVRKVALYFALMLAVQAPLSSKWTKQVIGYSVQIRPKSKMPLLGQLTLSHSFTATLRGVMVKCWLRRWLA
jgi:hypothetical protein